jgi:two-component system, OmpR family, phosphate regulon sensor histidine kinase PhoR
VGGLRGYWRLFIPIAAAAFAVVVATHFGGGLTGSATAVVATCLLTIFLIHGRNRALDEAVAATRRIAAGDFDHRIYSGARGELAPLTRAFNEMSEQLAARVARLTADSEQLRTILGGMVEGVIAIDAEQRIIFVNERATRLLDLHPPVAGRRLWEVVRHRTLHEVVLRALSESSLCRAELTLPGATTQSLTVHAARLPGPPARGAVVVLHDTTELRRLERIRQEFVANVSHELKTPLAVISACVETLQGGAVDDQEHRGKFLGSIAEQAERLNALILDLLSLARIESGESTLEFEAVPIHEVVSACLARHRTRAESQSLDLGMGATNSEAPSWAWADGEAVREILDNLVDNALKYTPAGGRVGVSWRSDGEFVVLEVEDTGVGVPAGDLPRIFERFYRVDKARSRELGGTGLGLAIVKHLTQSMGGQVSATSRVNSGSTFTVRLKQTEADRSSPSLHTREALPR